MKNANCEWDLNPGPLLDESQKFYHYVTEVGKVNVDDKFRIIVKVKDDSSKWNNKICFVANETIWFLS